MVLEVTSGTIATLIEEAALAHPRECCGLLLGAPDLVVRAQPAANVHPEPEAHFEIDPLALIAAHKAARTGGAVLVGYYHSHPNGRAGPSETDLRQAARDGRIHAIVAHGAVTWWRDGEQGFEALSTRLAGS